MERGGDAGDGKPYGEPLRFTFRDVILLAHRAGLSLEDVRSGRPAFEVRAILLDQIAQLEARKGDGAPDRGPLLGANGEPINPPDTPAPSWVDELPT